MEFVTALFNLWAFAAIAVLAAVSAVLYAKTTSGKKRLNLIGSFSQSAALAVSGLCALRLVTADITMEEVGPAVGRVLTIALYGALFNLACKIWSRLSDDKERDGSDAQA